MEIYTCLIILSLLLLLTSSFIALRLFILNSAKRALAGAMLLLSVLMAFHQVLSWRRVHIDGSQIDLFSEAVVCIVSLILVVGFFCVTKLAGSITEHSRAEEALKEANARLETLIQSMPDAVTFKDIGGKHLLVNRAIEKLTGRRKEELIGKTVEDFLTPEFADQSRQSDEEALRRSTIIHVEETHPDKDGATIFLDTMKGPIFDDKGNLAGLVTVSRDVTQRKLVEEALQAAIRKANEEKAKSDAIIAAIGDSLVIIDTEFKIMYQNNVDREIIGNHAGEFCYEAFEDRDSICEGCPVLLSLGDGRIHRVERLASTVTGDMHLDITVSPLRDPSGRIIAAIQLVRDVTERKKLEQALWEHRSHLMHLVDERTAELKRANDELRKEIAARQKMEAELLNAQKLESLGILAGGIAHDFNNLLTSVLGRTSLAMMDLDEKHPAHKELVEAERATLRAQELTQQLLTFSKGGLPIKRTASLGELIHESAGFALRGSRVRCDIQVPEGLWLVNVDEGQISQVLHNLLINAEQAMPEGGTVTVRCENLSLLPGRLSPLDPGKYVKVTVRDTGAGIPKEHLQKIFDPYFTTKQRGSGLGLATTYSIVRKHGGGISVESELGAGTTFTLLLPASEDVAAAVPVEQAALSTGSGKILLMDDEDIVLDSTGAALRRLGYEVAFAKEGSQAVEMYREALKSEPFDLVIMDLTVPGGLGGKEAIEQLIKIDPGVKAIVSSGYSNDPIMADFRNYGFAGVVPKPYRLKELAATVHKVIMEISRQKKSRVKETSKDTGASADC